MREDRALLIASLLAILLMTFHITDDYVRGYDPLSRHGFMTAVLILLVWLCGTLLLAARRWGFIIMILGGLFGAAMPVIHLTGRQSAQELGFFFLWTMMGVSLSGLFTAILGRELWALERDRRTKQRRTMKGEVSRARPDCPASRLRLRPSRLVCGFQSKLLNLSWSIHLRTWGWLVQHSPYP